MKIRLGFVPSYRFGYTEWCQKMRDDSLAAFAKINSLKIFVPQPSSDEKNIDAKLGLTPYGMVRTLDEAEAVAEYFQHQRVDGLILCPLDFGDERSAVKVAEKLGLPVLLYATREPPARQDPGMSRVSDSYCGNLSIAAGLYRRKIPFHYAGLFFPDEEKLLNELSDFVRAVAVVKSLRGARIGQVGVRPATFETVGYDEISMARSFGQNVIYADLFDLVSQAQSYPADDHQLVVLIAENQHSVPKVSVAVDYLENATRLELALTEFWQKNRLSALAMQCWPAIQKMMGISVCALYGRMTSKGMLTACEADVLGALSMLVNSAAALSETLPHFVDWTIQHRQNDNWLLAWHCGNAPISLASDPCQVALRSRRDMTSELPVESADNMAGLYQFQVKPGVVTFCRLAEYDGTWKMLIAHGDIIPSDEVLAGTWSWVQVRDHAQLYRTLVEEGFIHHVSMIHGNQVNALKMACKFLNIQAVVVD
jgi:L-fucose isomerase-like protein